MIECEILENGNLQLSIAEECDREELADNLQYRGFWSAFWDGMESHSCNGSFTPFDAGDANPFVGLTSAPCIAESMDIDDNGQCEIVGRFWYYDDYAINCPLEKLASEGRVVFQLA